VQAKGVSKVENLYTALSQRIISEGLPVGAFLPTEIELASEFSCSRNTVSKAISRLVHEGFVDRRKKAGTRVIRTCKTDISPSLNLDAFAFIYLSERHEGIWRTLSGFQQAAHGQGRRVITLSTGRNLEKEAEIVSRLVEFDIQGAVVYPLNLSAQGQLCLARIISKSRIPIVLADHNISGISCHSVRLDCFHAGYSVTSHLINKGLKQIGFFANNGASPSIRSRFQGYIWALKEADLAENEKSILLDPGMHPNYEQPLLEPTALAVKYLKESSQLEAVVCPNDYLAVGMIKAAQSLKIEIPRDLQVVGIDDFAISDREDIQLTTYHPPFEQIGQRCFDVLNAIASGNTKVSSETLVRGEMIRRKTA
jgi:GntR family transcriptional regulator of arabinose operon